MASFTVKNARYIQVDFTTAGDEATVTGKLDADAGDAALYSLAYNVDGPSIIIQFDFPFPEVTIEQTAGTDMAVTSVQAK